MARRRLRHFGRECSPRPLDTPQGLGNVLGGVVVTGIEHRSPAASQRCGRECEVDVKRHALGGPRLLWMPARGLGRRRGARVRRIAVEQDPCRRPLGAAVRLGRDSRLRGARAARARTRSASTSVSATRSAAAISLVRIPRARARSSARRWCEGIERVIVDRDVRRARSLLAEGRGVGRPSARMSQP